MPGIADALARVRDRINAAGPNTYAQATLTTYDSIHSDGGWKGSVGYNDNHVEFISTPQVNLKYGSGVLLNNDNLFRQEAANVDAYLVGTGSSTVPN